MAIRRAEDPHTRLPNQLSEYDKSLPLLWGYLAVYGDDRLDRPEKRHPVRAGNQPRVYRIGWRRRLEPLGNAFLLIVVEFQTTDQSRYQLALLSFYLEVYPCERADESHQEQSFLPSEFV
jgi:hypothetical protein